MNDARRLDTLGEVIHRRVSPEEAAAYISAPISDAERDEVLSLVRWFTRRYPTGAERLAYVRRAHRRWAVQQSIGPSRWPRSRR
jgi:hypothetical protein